MHDRLTNPSDIWSALENTLRPALTYCVTLPFDLASEEVSGGLVHTVEFRWQQVNPPMKSAPNTERRALPQPGPPQKKQKLLPAPGTTFVSFTIAGTVRDLQGKPLEGIQVRVRHDASFAITDKKGRYTLGRLSEGTYTLVAQTADGVVAEKTITLLENERRESDADQIAALFDFEMEV
jgi:hypothetical protein